ncbi:hypothetical protein F4859DRAFT_170378 [Xylaria cf. heliscus]|nr:hypothetical protein F4859DRAFT_170378 [Xylaria cf. heliscus]
MSPGLFFLLVDLCLLISRLPLLLLLLLLVSSPSPSSLPPPPSPPFPLLFTSCRASANRAPATIAMQDSPFLKSTDFDAATTLLRHPNRPRRRRTSLNNIHLNNRRRRTPITCSRIPRRLPSPMSRASQTFPMAHPGILRCKQPSMLK